MATLGQSPSCDTPLVFTPRQDLLPVRGERIKRIPIDGLPHYHAKPVVVPTEEAGTGLSRALM